MLTVIGFGETEQAKCMGRSESLVLAGGQDSTLQLTSYPEHERGILGK